MTFNNINLGAFSISLTVNDLEQSKAFYEKLGFVAEGGDCGQGWTILRNGDHLIGLFQGMFDKNMLTFNPGWDQNAKPLPEFTDVRALKASLERQGITILNDETRGESGPGSFIVEDPDGNPILIDQHR